MLTSRNIVETLTTTKTAYGVLSSQNRARGASGATARQCLLRIRLLSRLLSRKIRRRRPHRRHPRDLLLQKLALRGQPWPVVRARKNGAHRTVRSRTTAEILTTAKTATGVSSSQNRARGAIGATAREWHGPVGLPRHHGRRGRHLRSQRPPLRRARSPRVSQRPWGVELTSCEQGSQAFGTCPRRSCCHRVARFFSMVFRSSWPRARTPSFRVRQTALPQCSTARAVAASLTSMARSKSSGCT